MNFITDTMAVPAAVGGALLCLGSAGTFVLDLTTHRGTMTREQVVDAAAALLLALVSGWMSVIGWMVIAR